MSIDFINFVQFADNAINKNACFSTRVRLYKNSQKYTKLNVGKTFPKKGFPHTLFQRLFVRCLLRFHSSFYHIYDIFSTETELLEQNLCGTAVSVNIVYADLYHGDGIFLKHNVAYRRA